MSSGSELLAALRAELPAGSEMGPEDTLAHHVLDAVARRLEQGSVASSVDIILRDQLGRQLAWGSTRGEVLEDAGAVCARILDAASEQSAAGANVLLFATREVSAACARFVSLASVARAQAARAARVREENAQERLEKALEGQRGVLRTLTERG